MKRVKKPRWRLIQDNVPGVWREMPYRPGGEGQTVIIPPGVIPQGAAMEIQIPRKVSKNV